MITPPLARWRVRDARDDDAEAMARTMAMAFASDPVMHWMFPARRGRSAKILRYFKVMQHHLFLPWARALVTEDSSGVAFWVPPGLYPLAPDDVDAFVSENTSLFGARMSVLDVGAHLMEDLHPVEPHYYLAGVGVDPARQGRAIGSSLITPILAECDAIGLGAYLEASTARNIALYTRLGFAIVGEAALPDGPSLTLMWRAPVR